MLNCKELLPEPGTESGTSRFVMSWMLALLLNCALQGEVEVAPVQPDTQVPFTNCDTASAVMANGTWVSGCRSEEHTSELQSQSNLVCRLLLEKKKKTKKYTYQTPMQHTESMQ